MTCGTDLKTGEVDAVEIGKELPGQMSLEDVEEEDVQVDTETGEVISHGKVFDLRTAREA